MIGSAADPQRNSLVLARGLLSDAGGPHHKNRGSVMPRLRGAMTTELALNVHSNAIGALIAGAVLMIASMLSAMRDLPALTGLGHWIALVFGVVIVIYGTAAFRYRRDARLDDVPSSRRHLHRIARCET
jgi:type IV secretory pathway TrbD component